MSAESTEQVVQTFDGSSEATYLDRISRVASMMDVRKLFISNKELQTSLEKIKTFESSSSSLSLSSSPSPSSSSSPSSTTIPIPSPIVTREEYDHAIQVRDAIIHPDTGKPIPLPLRVSAILPANLILDFCMLKAQYYGGLVPAVAHFANQTYNVCHYFANRNASNDSDRTINKMLMAYGGAVTASVSTVMGLNHLAKKIPTTYPNLRVLCGRIVPFFGIAAADVINLSIMRWNEVEQGVNVYTENGELAGKSQIAGTAAVTQCIIGRVVAAGPILLIPPIMMHHFEKQEWLRRRPFLGTPIMLGMIGVLIQAAVPLFFGMYSQSASLHVSHMEKEFLDRKDSKGRSIERLYFNKGI